MSRFTGPSRFMEANPWLQDALMVAIIAALLVYLVFYARQP